MIGTRARLLISVSIPVLIVALASCGSPSSPSSTPPPSNPYTFTITGAGVNPKEYTVPLGTRVLFVNNDSSDHYMASDPHPDHTDCPELNTGVLKKGESRESGNLVTARTCGFHDHNRPEDASLKGRVIVR